MGKAVNSPERDPFPTRYSLLSRLHNWEDQKSWMEFFEMYWRLIHSVALKAGLTETEAQDVIQETVLSVAKNIHKFKREQKLGSFKSWLRNIIRWRIADQFKKRLPLQVENQSNDDEGHLENVPDLASAHLENGWDEEWQTNLMNAALDRVKRRVKEEHYLMFDLYVIKQRPPGEIAKTLGVGVGQVYLAKHRVAALIKKEIRTLEKKPF